MRKRQYSNMGNKITVVIIAVLLVLLAVAIVYIGYGKYVTANAVRDYNSMSTGFQQGYEQAVITVAQQAATCQQVPLRVGNQTLNIIAVDCLQVPKQQAQQTTVQ